MSPGVRGVRSAGHWMEGSVSEVGGTPAALVGRCRVLRAEVRPAAREKSFST